MACLHRRSGQRINKSSSKNSTLKTIPPIRVSYSLVLGLGFLETCQGMDGRTSYRLNSRKESLVRETLREKVKARGTKELKDA